MSLPTTTAVVGKAFVIRDGGDPYAIKQQQQSTHQHHSMNKVIHTCITDDLLVRGKEEVFALWESLSSHDVIFFFFATV